jgi:hypothetical protein
VRVNNASDWLPAREAARIDLGTMSSGREAPGEKLAADRNRRVFGMLSSIAVGNIMAAHRDMSGCYPLCSTEAGPIHRQSAIGELT